MEWLQKGHTEWLMLLRLIAVTCVLYGFVMHGHKAAKRNAKSDDSMKFLARIFTWWNGATPGTFLSLKRNFTKVGEDQFGNTYHEARDASPEFEGRKRRWVIYKGYADPSSVPAEWPGWLHHIYDETPDELTIKRHDWQLPHKPNMTGTAAAYRPKGSMDRGGKREEVTADYEAWVPGE